MQGAIVLVEDSDSVRLHLAEVLEVEGYTVLPAGSVESAVEYFALRDDIHLIITDYRLPRIDGSSWLKFLAKHSPLTARVGVISSYCVDPQGFPFLGKPFSDDQFLKFIDSILIKETFPV